MIMASSDRNKEEIIQESMNEQFNSTLKMSKMAANLSSAREKEQGEDNNKVKKNKKSSSPSRVVFESVESSEADEGAADGKQTPSGSELLEAIAHKNETRIRTNQMKSNLTSRDEYDNIAAPAQVSEDEVEEESVDELEADRNRASPSYVEKLGDLPGTTGKDMPKSSKSKPKPQGSPSRYAGSEHAANLMKSKPSSTPRGGNSNKPSASVSPRTPHMRGSPSKKVTPSNTASTTSAIRGTRSPYTENTPPAFPPGAGDVDSPQLSKSKSDFKKQFVQLSNYRQLSKAERQRLLNEVKMVLGEGEESILSVYTEDRDGGRGTPQSHMTGTDMEDESLLMASSQEDHSEEETFMTYDTNGNDNSTAFYTQYTNATAEDARTMYTNETSAFMSDDGGSRYDHDHRYRDRDRGRGEKQRYGRRASGSRRARASESILMDDIEEEYDEDENEDHFFSLTDACISYICDGNCDGRDTTLDHEEDSHRRRRGKSNSSRGGGSSRRVYEREESEEDYDGDSTIDWNKNGVRSPKRRYYNNKYRNGIRSEDDEETATFDGDDDTCTLGTSENSRSRSHNNNGTTVKERMAKKMERERSKELERERSTNSEEEDQTAELLAAAAATKGAAAEANTSISTPGRGSSTAKGTEKTLDAFLSDKEQRAKNEAAAAAASPPDPETSAPPPAGQQQHSHSVLQDASFAWAGDGVYTVDPSTMGPDSHLAVNSEFQEPRPGSNVLRMQDLEDGSSFPILATENVTEMNPAGDDDGPSKTTDSPKSSSNNSLFSKLVTKQRSTSITKQRSQSQSPFVRAVSNLSQRISPPSQHQQNHGDHDTCSVKTEEMSKTSKSSKESVGVGTPMRGASGSTVDGSAAAGGGIGGSGVALSSITRKKKGWKEYTDPTSGKKYYSNGILTTWKRPPNAEITVSRSSTPMSSNSNSNNDAGVTVSHSTAMTPVASNYSSSKREIPLPENIEITLTTPVDEVEEGEEKEKKLSKQKKKFKMFFKSKKNIISSISTNKEKDSSSTNVAAASPSKKKGKGPTGQSPNPASPDRTEATAAADTSIDSGNSSLPSPLGTPQRTFTHLADIVSSPTADYDAIVNGRMSKGSIATPTTNTAMADNKENNISPTSTTSSSNDNQPKKKKKRRGGWKEYTDPTSGKKYYSDGITTTWTKPANFADNNSSSSPVVTATKNDDSAAAAAVNSSRPAVVDKSSESKKGGGNSTLFSSKTQHTAKVASLSSSSSSSKIRKGKKGANGWREYTDANSGKKYYSNGITTSWERPVNF